MIETGTFLGRLPYARLGADDNPILVINGGQGFMMKTDRSRLAKDARRIARILPGKRSFVVIGYDPDPAGVTVGGLADDIGAVIDEHFGGRADVLGISYGAVVAAHVAAHVPGRVRRLVLMAGAHAFSAEGRRRLSRQIELAQRGELRQLLLEFASVFRRPWLNLLLRLRIGLGGRALVRRLGQRETIIRYLDAMLQDDIPAADLRNISANTLIIGGSRDQFFADTMRIASQTIPTARLVQFEGETHMVPVERARDVRAELARFLS